MAKVRILIRRLGLSALFGLMAVGGWAQQISPVAGEAGVNSSGAGGSYHPVFSQDGAFVVYLSHANNLVTNDGANLSLDLFRAAVYGGPTELISVSTNRVGGANADCLDFSVSRYGLNVAFATRA